MEVLQGTAHVSWCSVTGLILNILCNINTKYSSDSIPGIFSKQLKYLGLVRANMVFCSFLICRCHFNTNCNFKKCQTKICTKHQWGILMTQTLSVSVNVEMKGQDVCPLPVVFQGGQYSNLCTSRHSGKAVAICT